MRGEFGFDVLSLDGFAFCLLDALTKWGGQQIGRDVGQPAFALKGERGIGFKLHHQAVDVLVVGAARRSKEIGLRAHNAESATDAA